MSRGNEWDAHAYEELSTPRFAWGSAFMDQLDLGRHHVILDAGCGTGRLTARLCERGPHLRVCAIDRSANMVQNARAALRDHRARAWMVQSDVSRLPLRRPVDLIFSTATLHWIADHERLFSGFHDSLRADGQLAAQCAVVRTSSDSSTASNHS